MDFWMDLPCAKNLLISVAVIVEVIIVKMHVLLIEQDKDKGWVVQQWIVGAF